MHNNWVLLLAVAVVSLGGTILYAVLGEESAAIPLYFVVGAACVAGIGFAWFRNHPPAMRGPSWAYVAIVVAIMVGSYLAGTIPGSRAVGAWIVVGLGFVGYGLLERSRVIMIPGGLSAIAGILGLLADLRLLGLWLELFTGAVFAVAAMVLRSGRAPTSARH